MTNDHGERLGLGDPAVHAHLGILQGVISRLASNSQSCKTWCITIVAAIFVVSVNTMIDGVALIALLPAFLLGWLDMYYLGLERAFRNSYNDFVAALQQGDDISTNLYVVKPIQTELTTMTACFRSPAIWPFYSVLVAVAAVVAIIIHLTGD